VEVLEILTVATRVPGVAKINRVRLGDTEGGSRERIPLAGVELPRLMAAAVAICLRARFETQAARANRRMRSMTAAA
jgi:hypothetical protein